MTGTGPLVTTLVMKPQQLPKGGPYLLTCTLCSTYDHVVRLCPFPLLHQCRVTLNAQMDQHALHTDLEKQLIPQLIQLVLSPKGHRICLGYWNTAQKASLSNALLPTDSPKEAITAVLLDFSRTLVPRIDTLWKARKQSKYIEAVENSEEADPILLRAPTQVQTVLPPTHKSTQIFLRSSPWSRSRSLHLLERSPAAHRRHPQRLQAVQDPSERRSLRRPASHSRSAPALLPGCGLLHGPLCLAVIGVSRVGRLPD